MMQSQLNQHALPTGQILNRLNMTSGDLLSGRETEEVELTKSFLNERMAPTVAPINVQFGVSFADIQQKATQRHWRQTLSIKKRLREHLIVKKYYDQSPDYRELAREILGGKRSQKTSGVGLLDKNKDIIH